MNQIYDDLIIWHSSKQDGFPWPLHDSDTQQIVYQLHKSINTSISSGLKAIFFPKQVHGIDGVHAEFSTISSNFLTPADFCFTNQKLLGLGIVTADCVPLVLYDYQQKLIAAVHAGWRGSVAGITKNAVQRLVQQGANVKTMHAFFGPAARGCCYEIAGDLVDYFSNHERADQIVTVKNKKTYLDLVVYNQLVLQLLGINSEKIATDQALCTMCNDQFSSYRREGLDAARNITIVYLR